MIENNFFFTVKEHGGKKWESLRTVQQATLQELANDLSQVLRSMEIEGVISLSRKTCGAESEIQSDCDKEVDNA